MTQSSYDHQRTGDGRYLYDGPFRIVLCLFVPFVLSRVNIIRTKEFSDLLMYGTFELTFKFGVDLHATSIFVGRFGTPKVTPPLYLK